MTIEVYTQLQQGREWLAKYRGKQPILACILGFTATGLIPGISAAGATPEDRQYTAIADAEFLINGICDRRVYPLPPLNVGVSPVFITRAGVEGLKIPVYLFNAGLPRKPAVKAIDLGGIPANCLTSGKALPLQTVSHLFALAREWGEKLAKLGSRGYLIIGECVVGGTSTALGILAGLAIDAEGKVNSSHPSCNHRQKWLIVQEGLKNAGLLPLPLELDPFSLVAAVGDPMQIVAAGMAIAASRTSGVMLAGGTQMLAVCALIQAISKFYGERVDWQQIVVGTTRWVAEDPTGDTVGLAKLIGRVPLLATKLSFANSNYSQLRAYEGGYVKEGVAAGGCAIASHLYQNWTQQRLLAAIEELTAAYNRIAALEEQLLARRIHS